MKPVISLIAAAADNNVIGINNQMPWHIAEDFKHFKEITMGKPCIMGRKTFESILESLGKPLPGRVNIVVSRSNFQHGGALTCQNLAEAIDQASKTGSNEVCIVGGAQIYAQAIEQGIADRIYLTRVHTAPKGDAFFPALGPEWVEQDRDEREGFTFLTYGKSA